MIEYAKHTWTNNGGCGRSKSTRMSLHRPVRHDELMLTISTTAVGYKPKISYLVHKVLQCSIDGIVKFRFQQTLDDPITVPIIYKERVSSRSNDHKDSSHIVLGNVHPE